MVGFLGTWEDSSDWDRQPPPGQSGPLVGFGSNGGIGPPSMTWHACDGWGRRPTGGQPNDSGSWGSDRLHFPLGRRGPQGGDLGWGHADGQAIALALRRCQAKPRPIKPAMAAGRAVEGSGTTQIRIPPSWSPESTAGPVGSDPIQIAWSVPA